MSYESSVNILCNLISDKIENMSQETLDMSSSDIYNGQHLTDSEMTPDHHNRSDDSQKWLEYPLEIESYKSRFLVPDNKSESIMHLKNLNL